MQTLVVFAVVLSNTYWRWTPNFYLALLIGIGCAYLVANLQNRLWHRRRGLPLPGTIPKRPDHQ